MTLLIILLVTLIVNCLSFPSENAKIDQKSKTVLCLGDSITNGSGSSHKELYSYPSLLSMYLNSPILKHLTPSSHIRLFGNEVINGSSFRVVNLGISGTKVMKNVVKSYWYTKEFNDSVSLVPNVVIVGFGTNDVKTMCWKETDYIVDYIEFIQIFQNKPSNPAIYLLIPPPVYEDMKFNIQQNVVNKRLPTLIRNIAAKTKVEVIDVFSNLGGAKLCRMSAFYNESRSKGIRGDGIHPNDVGYFIIAHTIASKLLGNDIAHKIRSHLMRNNAYLLNLYTDNILNTSSKCK